MNDCRAAVITAHNQPLQIQRVSVPDLEPGALLIKITASTLCGTDVHRWHGPLGDGDSLPIITGHEPCGFVEDIAGERTDILGNPVKRGDRIVWSYVACGSCYYCAVALQPCICPGRASWGHNRSDQHPYLLGSCSEFMYVPKECLIIRVADAVLNLEEVTEEKQRRQWVRDHTEGRGADIVIQVANNMAVPEGLTMLRGGGRYLNIGAGGKANIAVEKIPQEMLFITVRSAEPRHWLQAIDFLASRRKTFPFEEMISKSYTLDQINEAMAAMASYSVVKAVINLS